MSASFLAKMAAKAAGVGADFIEALPVPDFTLFRGNFPLFQSRAVLRVLNSHSGGVLHLLAGVGADFIEALPVPDFTKIRNEARSFLLSTGY